VVLPCWNAAPYLDRALASLASQTFTDFEVIAVDDGSTDETPLLLEAWAQRDARVSWLRRGHEGLVAALNAGLKRGRGRLVARMDGDDIAHPRRFEWQVALFDRHPDVTVAGGLVRCFPRARLAAGMQRYERWLNSVRSHEQIAHDLFVESPIAHPSVMMRTEAVAQVGGYRAVGWPEDYDLWFRLYEAGARFEKSPHVVVWWRDREQRATRTSAEYTATQFRRCKVHYLKRLHLGGRARVAVWGAGKEGRALGKHLKREEIEVARYLDIAPTKIGGRLLGAPVQGGDALRRDEYLLVAVGAAGARELIRAGLAERGWREPEHYRTMA